MARRKANDKSQLTFTPTIPSLTGFHRLLEQTTRQACSELVEGALSQLEFGLADMAPLYSSLSSCELYSALLRRGYRLVSRAMSPGEINEALHQVASAALAAGWIAHESGVQSAILTRLISPPPPEAPAPPSPRATTFAEFMRNQRPGSNIASPSPPAQSPADRRPDSQEPSKDRRSRRKAEEQ
jgi:hypothetical protein